MMILIMRIPPLDQNAPPLIVLRDFTNPNPATIVKNVIKLVKDVPAREISTVKVVLL